MTQTYKQLGQSAPNATTLTDLYTVPASTQTVVSNIWVCNRGAAAATFRVSKAIAGAADATKQYIVYDAPLQPGQSIPVGAGISLQATDKIRVYASTADLSFNADGCEIT